MQRTPLYEAEAEHRAAFGDVDGWEMPKVFENVKAEYLAGKRAVGVADRSHWGRLRVTGEKRLDLLHRITTNHVKDLEAGQGAETVMCTPEGRIVDRLFVQADDDHCVLVASPNMAPVIKEKIEKVRFRDDVTLEDVTRSTAMITLLGPESGRLLERSARTGAEEIAPHQWRRIEVDGIPAMAVGAAGMGGGGFNLIAEAAQGSAIWRALLRKGASHGVAPVGAEALEMLRVEFGVPAWGREITEEFNPLEARLDSAIHRSKGCYTGQEVIARLESRRRIRRFLVGFLIDRAGVPEPRSRVFAGSQEVGVVTSVAPSLEMRTIVALGYIRAAHVEPGTRVQIHSRGDVLEAEVAALPFETAGARRTGPS